MLFTLTPETIFQINPKIGVVRFATVKGKRGFSGTRPGHEDLVQHEQMALHRLPSEFLTEINVRSESPAERVGFVLTGYGGRYGIIIPRGETYLRLVVEKSASCPELMEIAEAVQRLPI